MKRHKKAVQPTVVLPFMSKAALKKQENKTEAERPFYFLIQCYGDP